MRVVVTGIHPVSVHGAQVLDLKLEKGRGKLFGIPELHGEGICGTVSFCL